MLHRDEGEAWWWGDGLAVIKATAADTDGELTVVEVSGTPGSVTPSGSSSRYRIFGWTLDGEATFEREDGSVVLGPGSFYSVPREAPTGRVRVGEAGWRALWIVLPGGFEELIRGLSEPAERLTLPPPPGVWPSFDPSELLARHGFAPAE